MKKYIAFGFALICIFSLAGCNSADTSEGNSVLTSLASFSYEEDYMLYYDDFGLKTSDFLNADVCLIDGQKSAVEQAENECTIEYNATSEYYDNEAEMWRVDFQTVSREQGVAILVGTRQSVYLDNNGITHLIVYHEEQQ
ncbi:hypothetical protein [Pseudoflavonifractor sp. 60]|uniref:hypothetical protein n=1 Tax=Pseudoflavonifractor sp. 60 TaxID=2304576 RepID=UPI00136CCEE8|nr:hypothetical protein [Pseudoflavonifractor sp. 60]